MKVYMQIVVFWDLTPYILDFRRLLRLKVSTGPTQASIQGVLGLRTLLAKWRVYSQTQLCNYYTRR